MASRHAFVRTVINHGSVAVNTFASPIRGNRNALEFKALLRRSPNYYAVKVGAFGSPTRLGQIAQGVGTALLPGNISPARSPIRSGIYSALTPGSPSGAGGVLAPRREERGYRCPEGFQYGGRFTDSRFSTCGQMLFDIFSLGSGAAPISRLVKPVGPAGIVAAPGGSASPIPGLSPQEQQIIISRAAQIPRIGVANPERRQQSVTDAIKALATAEDGVTLMVRRDGFSLRPVVSTAILRTVPDNRNMEGASFLTAVSSINTVGQDELGLLSNTGVTDLQYVAPNGVTLSLRKTRPLTVGERRKLGKNIAQIAKADNSDDPSARLKELAAQSGGAISYSESLGSINKPNDIVSVTVGGSKRQVRRWVYDTFLKKGSKRVSKPEPPKEVAETNDSQIEEKISSLAEAVKHLDAGGDPSRVLPSLLPLALQRTRTYQTRRIDKFTKRHDKAGKHSLTEHAAEYQFEHLSTRLASDIQKLTGLDSEAVLFAGKGTRAPYVSVSPTRPGQTVKQADNLDNLPPAQVLALAISDYITDHRDRSPATTQIVTYDGKTYIRSADNKLTLLAGIPNSRQSARQRLGIDQAINDDRAQYYGAAFRKLSDSQRRSVVRELDEILDRLAKFSWAEYTSRLQADGELSAAELAHIEIQRSLVEGRLSRLKSSKARFLELLSISQ